MKTINNESKTRRTLSLKEQLPTGFDFDKNLNIQKNKDYDSLFLNIDGVEIELTRDIEAKQIILYKDGDWAYEDGEGNWYLFRLVNNKEWIEAI